MPALSPRTYRFDDFELDALKRRLLRQAQPVTLQPKAFDLLLALVENRDRLLSKDDLLRLVWPDQIVEESNLTVHMSALRRALGEHRAERRFVVTEPGRGYRFVADVTEGADETSSTDEDSIARTAPAGARAAFGRSRPAALVAGVACLVVAALFFLTQDNSRSDGQSAVVAGVPGSPIALTRLTNGGNVTSAVISPDGKHFAYTMTESAGQSLWIRQVGGGSSVRIGPPEAVDYWGLTFSPDGAYVYSSVFESNRAHTALRRVPALGGRVESLGLSPLSAITFSPDGRRFAFVQTNAAVAESLVKVANADGSDLRVLARRAQPAYFDFVGPTVSWSRDGELIASVVMSSDPGGDYMTVVGVRADGTGETPLTTKRWAGVSEVAWSFAGGLVVVANEEPSTPSQVWLVTRPGGDARPLTSDLNVYSSISVTTDAKTLMLVQRNSIAGLWVQSVAGPGDARQIGSEVGGFEDMGWMPDGRLVYRSSTGAGADLWILDMEGTAPAQVTTDAHVSQGLAISPDGRYVVFAATRAGKENLWRYGVADETLTQLTDGDGEVFPRVTGDSRWVIYQRGRGAGKPTLWRVPIDGGAASPLVETHAMRHDLSPDGQLVAYFSMDLTSDRNPQWRMVVASVHDGSFVRSFEIPATLMPRVLRFTPDGQALAYIDTVGGVGNIWHQPLAGGPPQQMTTFDQGALDTFAYSRDGHLLAMTRATRISDVAVIRDAQ